MSKKRRTRSQKIISALKRKINTSGGNETISLPKITYIKKPAEIKPPEQTQIFTYDPNLIKKDLVKTLYISIVFFVFIGLFYWTYALGGETVIRRIFRL